MKQFIQEHYPKYLVLLITLIILGGGIFYYFAVNVEDNKKELNRKAFRTIDRTVTNAYEKLQAYKVNNRFLLKEEMKVRANMGKTDSLSDSLIVDNVLKWLLKNRDEKKDTLILTDSLYEEVNLRLQNMGVTILSVSKHKTRSLLIAPDHFLVQDTLRIGSNTFYYVFQLEFEEFLDPLIHNDFLNEYIVFASDPTRSQAKLKKLYTTFSNKIDISPLLLNNEGEVQEMIIRGSALNEFVISGRKYQAFLQPIGGKNNKHFLVCGLMRAEDYQSLAQNFNFNIVLVLIGLIFFAALLIPILNVVFSNAARPVHYSDITIIVISFMGITSLITIFLSGGYGFGLIVPEDRKNGLKELANTIEHHFIKDFEAGLHVLTFFENGRDRFIEKQKPKSGLSPVLKKYINSKPPSFYSPWPVNENEGYNVRIPFQIKNNLIQTHYNLINTLYILSQIQYYIDQIHSVFHIDSKGIVQSVFTDSEDSFTGLPLKQRPYFSIVNKGEGWNYKNFNNIYLQSIHGYTDGTSEAILSIKSDGPLGGVLATEHNLFSLKNTCLPDGKGFAVINEDGQVLFHSDASYNAYENFLKECDFNYHATSSVFSRNNEFFHAFYHKKNHLFYIHPIKNLPLFLVVFEDDGLFTAAHIEVVAFVLSNFIFLWLGILLIFVVVLLMSRLKTMQNKSFILKKQSLFPDVQNSKCYPLIISGLCAVVLYQFFILWLFPEWLNLNSPSRLVLSFISVLFGEIFTLYLLYKDAEKQKYRSLRLIAFLGGVGAILVILGGALVNWGHEDMYHFLIAVLLLFCVLLVFPAANYFGEQGIRFFIQKSVKKPDGPALFKKYKVILWLFTLMAAINPTFLFYNLSFQQESEILSKFRELKILKSWLELKGPKNKPEIAKDYSAIVFICPPQGNKALVNDSTESILNKRKYLYVLPPFKVMAKNNNTSFPSSNQIKENYFEWLSHLRLPYNEYARTSTKLTSLHEGLDFWYWNQNLKALQLSSNYFSMGNLQITGETEDFTSRLLRYFKKKPTGGFFFVMLVGFLAWVLWKLIDRFIDTFTRFGPYLNEVRLESYEKQLFYNIKNGRDQVIISPPGTRALELLVAKINETDIDTIEFIDLKEELIQTEVEKELALELIPEDKHVVITNFSYDLYDEQSNQFKFQLLEKLQTIKTLSISIVTHTYSLDHFVLPNNKPELRHKWKSLHQHFVKVYVPLYKQHYISGEPVNKPESCRQLLEQELKYGEVLPQLFIDEEEIDLLLKDKDRKCDGKEHTCEDDEFRCKDKLLFELQSRASLYYQTLWESFTIDEQQLLYDLAEDGLVNIGNKNVIHKLLLKGILKLEDSKLMLFNKSFHSFILLNVDKKPILAYTEQANPSKWQYFKMPFILSLIVLFFFIMISQNIEFKHIIPALTAMATALPALFNLSPSAVDASEKVVEKVFHSK